MNGMLAIAGREWRAFFLSPGGYVITAVFLLATAVIFIAGVFQPGAVATLQPIFLAGPWLLMMLGPAITMRSISEELRSGTLDGLLASPVGEGRIIVGKFLGALAFLLVLLAATAAYVFALEWHGRPDYGEIMCGYFGLLLAGSAYLASGLLASTLTASQAVAYLLAVFFWFTINVATAQLPARLPDSLARVLFLLNPQQRLNNFAIGLIDGADVAYFASLAVLFLFAAVVGLQSRRWP